MKTLYIVRHAKSSWKEAGLTDFERPLNKRGKRDAPFMGQLFCENKLVPDIMISSPALRAITTAREFANQLEYPIEKLITNENIYEAGLGNLMTVVNTIPDINNSAMIFGHNPGLTMLCNYLGDKYIDNLPTCGAVKIEFDLDSWDDIVDESGKIIFFEYPKKYLD